MSSTHSITLTSNKPLPLCYYQQVAWLGTPTTYKMFAEVDASIFEKHVFINVHFKEIIPAYVEQFKQPCDRLDKGKGTDIIEEYGEKLILCGYDKSPIMYSSQLSKSEKNSLVQDCAGVDQFPTVTGVSLTLYDLAGMITQEDALSSDQLCLLTTVREKFNAHFPKAKVSQ